jgi:hypothetical protein
VGVPHRRVGSRSGLCLFLELTVLLDLRLLGVTFRSARASVVAARLEPWIIFGFVLMVTSGSLLFYAIPVRTFQNIFFRIKVAMPYSGRDKCVGLSRDYLPARGRVGSGPGAAQKSEDGRRFIPGSLGRHRCCGTNDCV